MGTNITEVGAVQGRWYWTRLMNSEASYRMWMEVRSIILLARYLELLIFTFIFFFVNMIGKIFIY